MDLTDEQRRRILDQVYVHESGTSAHLSEPARALVLETSLTLMAQGVEPASASELADTDCVGELRDPSEN